jgi:hypothetical protein
MTTTLTEGLSPLERLHLRDLLQDLWRVQVRRITLLSLEMYDELEAEDPALGVTAAIPGQVDVALAEARAVLTDLESAMHRLDEDGFGNCRNCGSVIGFAALMADPLSALCLRCRPPRIAAAPPMTTDVRCGG